MNKKWLVVGALALIGVLGVVGLTGCSGGTTSSTGSSTIKVSNQQEGIWVSGEGKISVAPDLATLNIGVQSQNTTVAAAREQAGTAMQAVMDSLTTNGIDSKDIQTAYFSITQTTKYDNIKNEQVPTGYQVSNTVTVKIHNLDNIGTIIDSVTSAGGDFIRINNINFSVEDPTNDYAQARDKAMADAKAKAQQLASLSGVTLGNATYVSESNITPPVIQRTAGAVYATAAAAPDTSTSISPGELDITVDVQVAYAIQ